MHQVPSRTIRHHLFSLLVILGMFVALLPLHPQVAQAQAPGDVVVNEIMQNPDAVNDGDGEWFEVVNTTGSDIDINGWTISDNGSDSHDIDNGGPLVVPAGGYLVLGNNTDTATNGGLTVDYGYGGSFFLANGADELVITDTAATEIDRVEWDGGATFPDPTGASMALDDPANDNNDGANWCTASTPYGAGDLGTPGAANDCTTTPPPPPLGVCTDPATFIYDVQGSGGASPLVGTNVVIEGIVVGDFQNNGQPDNGDLDGFHVQEEDADTDGDPATSDGIFVFAPGAADVSVGDQVRVLGEVSEFFDLTEISLTEMVTCSEDNPLPQPGVGDLPVDSPDDFEAFEGMRVTFPQDLSISEYFNFDRFGEIVLTDGRQFQPTALFGPATSDAADLADLNARNRITLDDGRTVQNPDPALHPNGDVFDLDNLFRGGDTVANVTGVMDYSFGLYRIQPTQGADYTAVNTRPTTHGDVGSDLEVASFNVLNYFTTLDTGSDICGPAEDQGCRGADNTTELDRQRAKIVAALAAMDSDVVGLIEIENHPGDVPTADLVDALNAEVGAGTYDFIETGAIGTDAIRQALIYKPATVEPVGDYAILDSSVDPQFNDEKNRPVLAQTFLDLEDGGVFTVAVNHLKSKGSECGPGDDDPIQGNCNVTRTEAAEAMVDWLGTDPTGSGDEDFLIIGDLNAYDKEDPITALLDGGYTDLVDKYQGENAYSYVFDGQLGYLDHGLANPGLVDEVTGATVWHINADEPDLIDYDTSFKQDAQDAIYAPDPYRSSDHDPVVVGLGVCDEIAPEVSVSVDKSLLWPPNHRYHTVSATVEASDNFDTDPTVDLVSVTSNEPDNGHGDGNTVDDIVIVDDTTFKLRAERSGMGDGRVYTITYQVTDDCGNTVDGTANVYVPRSIGRWFR